MRVKRMNNRKKTHLTKTVCIALGSLAIIGVFVMLVCVIDGRKNMTDSAVSTENLANQEIEKISGFEQSSERKTDKKEGRWIYWGSTRGDNLGPDQKRYLDGLIEQWTTGGFTDDELSELMTCEIRKQNLGIQTAGVLSNQICLFENEWDIPDYDTRLKTSNGIYEFIGLYTEDEVSEEGRLICYYWEAGVR